MDESQCAIDQARTWYASLRVRPCGKKLEFRTADMCREVSARGRFDAVLDCGYFQTIDQAWQFRYARNLALSTAPGGRLLLLCAWTHGLKRHNLSMLPGDSYLAYVQAAFTIVFDILWMEETVMPGKPLREPSNPPSPSGCAGGRVNRHQERAL